MEKINTIIDNGNEIVVSEKTNNFLHSQNYVMDEKKKKKTINNFIFKNDIDLGVKYFLVIGTICILVFLSDGIIKIFDGLLNMILSLIVALIFKRIYYETNSLLNDNILKKYSIYILNPTKKVKIKFEKLSRNYGKNYYFEIIKK